MISTTCSVDTGTWLVLLDGGRLRVLENVGTRARPRFEARIVKSRPVPPDRDLGSDRPGRTYRSLGPGRSAVAGASRHTLAELQFVADACRDLVKLADGPLPPVLVVAPSKAMAAFRQHASDSLRNQVVAEIVADLAKEPVEQLEERFAER